MKHLEIFELSLIDEKLIQILENLCYKILYALYPSDGELRTNEERLLLG